MSLEQIKATTGRVLAAESPAAKVSACPSAIPTSKKRLGYFSAKAESPVPSRIAAVIAQIRSSPRASVQSASPIAREKVAAVLRFPQGGSE